MSEIPENPVIRGAKVWLRPATVDDAILMAQATQDKDTSHFTLFDKPQDPAAMRKQFEDEVIPDYGKTSYMFAICPLGSNAGVGLINLNSIDHQNGAADLGIFIKSVEERGQGYGSDAINALMDFTFGELPIERLVLYVVHYNERAFDLYRRLGFVHEGTHRNAWFHRGLRHDVHVMAILREEWEALSRPRSWEYDG